MIGDRRLLIAGSAQVRIYRRAAAIDQIIDEPLPARQLPSLQIKARNRGSSCGIAQALKAVPILEDLVDPVGKTAPRKEIYRQAVDPVLQHLEYRRRRRTDDEAAARQSFDKGP